MSTRYLEILARQRPFPFALDEKLRLMYTCNYDALAAAPVADMERELEALLISGGLVTSGETLFGPASEPPDGDGPYVTLLDTGGIAPEETHDGRKYERLSFQVVVRASDGSAARASALAIWRLLDGQRNVTVAL